MKKFSVLAVAAIFVLGLSSCKKDYTCTCSDPGQTVADVYPINGAKKADAEESCDATKAVLYPTGTCTLDAK